MEEATLPEKSRTDDVGEQDNSRSGEYEEDWGLHELVLLRKRRKVEAQRVQRQLSRQTEKFYSFLPVRTPEARLYTLFRGLVIWNTHSHKALRKYCNISRRSFIQSNTDSRRLQFSLSELLMHGKRYSKHYGALISLLHSVEGFLVRGFPNCTPSDWSALESLPGCIEQIPHRDYTSRYRKRKENL